MDVKLLVEAPFVGVVWDDANSSPTEEYTPEGAIQDNKPSRYFTLGFKIVDNEKGITLFSEQCLDEKSLRSRNFIPKGMVVAVVEGEKLAKLLGLRKPRTRRVKNEEVPEAGKVGSSAVGPDVPSGDSSPSTSV